MKTRPEISIVYFIAIWVCCASQAWAQSDMARDGVDYSGYMQQIEERIKSDWRPPTMKRSTRAVVFFNVSKTGEILEAKITKPSLYNKIDESVLAAVNAASPLPPPPGTKKISVQFTFDYNVFGRQGNKLSDLSQLTRYVNSETLGFLLGLFLVLSLIVYKLWSLGRPPRDETFR